MRRGKHGGRQLPPRRPSNTTNTATCARTPVPRPSMNPAVMNRSKLVTCKAGGLVRWDSRTIHCTSPAVETPDPTLHLATELLRAA